MSITITKKRLQHVLDAIDENIFYKDTEGRYVLATHVCSMLNSQGDPDFTIFGKTDMEIQVDKKLGKKFYEEDMRIVKTGESLKYIQEMWFGSDVYYYEITRNPVIDDDGSVIGIVGVIKDMTELLKLQKQLEYYNITDMMTQTFNRSYYESGEYMKDLKYPVCVVMADINNLKYYNDNCGHKEGDILIKTIVNNIRRYLRTEDRLIRIGGDEFLILLQNCSEKQGNAMIAQIESAEENMKLQDIIIGTAYGSCIANNEEELKHAIEAADEKMYINKRKSKNI